MKVLLMFNLNSKHKVVLQKMANTDRFLTIFY